MAQSAAFLLRRYPYANTSLIIHWLTRDHGLIKTLAKGATRNRSPFSGRLELFVSGEIAWLPSRKSDLHLLTEVVPKDYHSGIPTSYSRLMAAAYLDQLLERLMESQTNFPEIYDLVIKAYGWLDSHDPRAEFILRFEIRLAQLLGLGHHNGSAENILSDYAHGLPAARRDLFLLMEQIG